MAEGRTGLRLTDQYLLQSSSPPHDDDDDDNDSIDYNDGDGDHLHARTPCSLRICSSETGLKT